MYRLCARTMNGVQTWYLYYQQFFGTERFCFTEVEERAFKFQEPDKCVLDEVNLDLNEGFSRYESVCVVWWEEVK